MTDKKPGKKTDLTEEQVMGQAPRRKAKALVNDHGPSGWLIVRLQRYTLLGWFLFLLLAMVFVLYVLVAASRPVPVIAVDESGRLLGAFDYLDPALRTDAEILQGAKHWLKYYYSLNSKTIFEDYTAALNMMDDPLRQAKLQEVIELNYLKQIEVANTRSHLEYQKHTLVSRRAQESIVELSGNIVINNGTDLIDKPFYLQLTLRSVSRSRLGQLGTLGLEVMALLEK